jgi:hypothetical protein
MICAYILKAFDSIICDTYLIDVEIDGQCVELVYWNPNGQDSQENARSRPLSYASSQVFLVCFAIDNPESLRNVSKFVSTVNHYFHAFPMLTKINNIVDPRYSTLLPGAAYHFSWT